MSQKTRRGSASLDEKGRTDSPIKDMKKKAAANAEKERAAAEKAATAEPTIQKTPAQTTDKTASANQKPGPASSKVAPNSDKTTPTIQNSGKSTPTAGQNSGKTTPTAGQNSGKSTPTAGQNSGKSTPTAGQNSGKAAPGQNSGKAAAVPATNLKDIPLPEDKKDEKTQKEKAKGATPEPAKAVLKENGDKTNGDPHNGVGVADAAPNRNGRTATPEVVNGNTVSDSSPVPDEDLTMEDELFPELTYDDTSDAEEGADVGRSITRRSQVKATRTPETPRPASHKPEEKPEEAAAGDATKDTKLLKLREEYSASPMKLRSSDRSTPDPKTQEQEEKKDEKTEDTEKDEDEKESKNENDPTTKRDTNFSKSRIKISPYRRSTRLQDSMVANYTGNNTTMEMDISEMSEQASGSVDPALDASYVNSLKGIRGRRSYKHLSEFVVRKREREIGDSPAETAGSRPTANVVGRKRKPLDDDEDFTEYIAEEPPQAPVKRMRMLDRVVSPFVSLVRRRNISSSTPLPARHSQPIVGINTDLPLHGPIGMEPETLPVPPEPELIKTLATDIPTIVVEPATEVREDTRQKCLIM